MSSEEIKKTVEIVNLKGLHARASAKFAETAARFDAIVKVTKDDISVHGTSIMGLMLLAAAKGERIQISASGQDADAALEALINLVGDKFGEERPPV